MKLSIFSYVYCSFYFYFLYSPEDMLTDSREGEGRKREREKNIHVREKYQWVASCTHPHRQPKYVP